MTRNLWKNWAHGRGPCAPSTDERFAETSWSVVIAAGAITPARAHAAMAELCRMYWRPIYAYLRRSGYNAHDAQDITQSFFQHLLENETLRRVSREKGRFRSFLLGVLKRCLADEQTHRHARKRGGKCNLFQRTNSRPRRSIICESSPSFTQDESLARAGRAWCWSALSTRFAQIVPRRGRLELRSAVAFSPGDKPNSAIRKLRSGWISVRRGQDAH